MSPSRRSIVFIFLAVAILLVFGGCTDTPTTIVVSVSFLNNPPREFPPTIHPDPANIDDDVCYVRLVENDGAGPLVVWESDAIPVTFLSQYPYPFPDPDPYDDTDQVATSVNGVHIDSFSIELTDAEVSSAGMPLRLEAYLFDTAMAAPIDPLNVLRYSYYDPAYNGDPGWTTSMTITGRTIKICSLNVTVPGS